jgi:hypothetical protein
MSEHWSLIEAEGCSEVASALLVALHDLRAPNSRQDPVFLVARLSDPEPLASVEFVGLSADEQRKALASFPGGARFRVQQISKPAA